MQKEITLNNARYAWIDIARGIAMLLIVCGHYAPKELMFFLPLKWLVFCVMSFHVPVFFILSGYVMRANGSFSEFLVKRLKYLIAPWLLFVIIGAVLKLASGEIEAASLVSTFLYGNLATPAAWFIPVLFVAQILCFFIAKAALRLSVLLQIAFLAAAALVFYITGYFVYTSGVNLPFGLQRAVYGAFFVLLGMVFSALFPIARWGDGAASKADAFKLVCVGLVSLALVWRITVGYGFYFDLANMTFPNYWLYALTGVLGFVFVAAVSLAIKSCALLECYGHNSLFICLTHEYFIRVYNNSGPFFRPYFASNSAYMLFMTLAGGVWFIAFMLFYYPLCGWKNKLLKRIGYRK